MIMVIALMPMLTYTCNWVLVRPGNASTQSSLNERSSEDDERARHFLEPVFSDCFVSIVVNLVPRSKC